MSRINRDVVVAIVLLLVCGAFLVASFEIEETTYGTMPSRVWPQSRHTISSYARYRVSGWGLSRSCSVRGMSSSPRHAMISLFPRMGKL